VKKFSVALVAMVFVGMMSSSASAQVKMGLGIKAGLNIASLSGKDADSLPVPGLPIPVFVTSNGSRIGLVGGGFFSIYFNDIFAAQIEAEYSMKGKKYTKTISGNGMSITIDATAAIDYLEIPILAKVVIPTSGSLNPFVYVGPSIGILLSAKSKYSASGAASADTTVDGKDYINGSDFGLAFGAGIAFKMGLLFDLRYTLGLSTIGKKVEGMTESLDMKNGVFAIMAGYEFKL
jgi:opacity protein-like surface antigen